MKTFVISDTHFGHRAIIDYCNRPFDSVDEMDAVLIKNWNSVVKSDDTVIHLGDFALTNRERAKAICKQLKGRKILVKGNHDCWSDGFYRECGFDFVSPYPIVYKGFWIMSHYPVEMPQICCYANAYGHIHTNPDFCDNDHAKCFSVERINYTPKLIFENDVPIW